MEQPTRGCIRMLQLELGAYAEPVMQRLDRWCSDRWGQRLWQKDPTLWGPAGQPEIVDRLGWLDLPAVMPEQIEAFEAFASEVQGAGIHTVVLLGMGGSSLAAEVFARTLASVRQGLDLYVLDTTHPDTIASVADGLDPGGTLFLVASKSGTTAETMALFRFFWHWVNDAGIDPGTRFVAITDPGTPLDHLAQQRAFRAVFHAPPDVGGRFSALSVFGLLPAALAGVDISVLLATALQAARECGPDIDPRDNPGLRLGAALGELALRGRDKVTLRADPPIASFPLWLEQLIAESTGKSGRGCIPVVNEPDGFPGADGEDRVWVVMQVHGMHDPGLERGVIERIGRGQPVIRMELPGLDAIGYAMFLWEVAIVAAGSVLEVHPLNQPDVQLAKDLTRAVLSGQLDMRAVHAATVSVHDRDRLQKAWTEWQAQIRPGDYIALQAFLAPSPDVDQRIQALRKALQDRHGVATTAGYGPRFLHSTGQLHKGGPNIGVFLQLVDTPRRDLPIPEETYTFGDLIHAQAAGDFAALRNRGRRVLRVHLGEDPCAGLDLLGTL